MKFAGRRATRRVEKAMADPERTVRKVGFEARASGSVGCLYKADGTFGIWGPASVEIVDKEDDRIKASALKEALPQLLKRSALSFEHSDQIVGEILERIETDEPIEVEINGQTFKRQEFPTDVLELDGMEPALYVAGNVFDDTQKAQEVRKAILDGEIDSYSISGEAIVSEMKVKEGRPVTDILKLDLSAVTLCAEGMNQMAKFAVVRKYDDGGCTLSPQRAEALLKHRTMTNDTDGDEPLTKGQFEAILDKNLPDGELATKDDIEETVDKAVEEKLDDVVAEKVDDAIEEKEMPAADPPDEEEEVVDDPDEVDEMVEDPADEEKAYTKEDLKSLLADDQFKAIEPLLDGEEPMASDEDAQVEVEDEPEIDEMVEASASAETAKSVGDLDWDRLTDDQKKAIAKSGALAKAGGASAPLGADAAQPGYAGGDEADDIVKNAETTVSGSKFFDEEGKPLL